MPRVEGGPGTGGRRVEVPWAPPRSGFTLFMEPMVLLPARSGMTVAEAARTVGEYPKRVWTVLLHHVAEAHGRTPTEMKTAAKTIRAHGDGVLAYLKTRVPNGAVEALNGIIRTVKRKAHGFRTADYFTAVIHLVASHLSFNLPNPLPVTHTKSP